MTASERQIRVAEAVAAALATPVETTTPVHRGGNNELYSVTCADGQRCIAKIHAPRRGRATSPLEAEQRGLQFLRHNGVEEVPRVLATLDNPAGLVLSLIEGDPVLPETVTAADVDVAADFLIRLSELRHSPGADLLPDASEACNALQDIVRAVDRRVARLRSMRCRSLAHRQMTEFIDHSFSHGVEAVVSWARAAGPPLEHRLPRKERTLSPSDFGFHNALRRSDGSLVFIDFEYFGWDDPAKMIADFLLHPGMSLSASSGRRFIRRILGSMPAPDRLADRLRRLYPLQALNWCLILLNEFIPEVLARRRQAAGSVVPDEHLQLQQLARSQARLDHVLDSYKRFAV